MKDDFGDRMKGYEAVTDFRLPCLTPVVVRVDGRAFHTLTKKLKKPFDSLFCNVMRATMKDLCEELPNVRFAYVQSDEISLVMLEREVRSEAWFSNRLQKIVSLTAALATRHFLKNFNLIRHSYSSAIDWSKYDGLFDRAVFDCRAFPVPERDVCNYFIWRQMDCSRNAVLSAGQALIGKKAMHGMNTKQVRSALAEKGIDYETEFPVSVRLGSACYRVPVEVKTDKGTCMRMKYEVDTDIPEFKDNRAFIEDHMGISDSK